MRDWMRMARKRRGLSLEVAAARMGVTVGYLSMIERGLRMDSMSLEFAVRVAGALGLPLDNVIRWEKMKNGRYV